MALDTKSTWPRGAVAALALAGAAALLAGCHKSGAPAQDATNSAAKGPDPVSVVENFDKTVMQHRASEAIMKYVSADFIEHDPTVKGGNRQGLFDYMVKAGWDEKSNPFPDMKDVVDRRFGSGEYVVTEHHIMMNKQDKGTVFVDTFRVVDGKIVEHWDVAQKVPDSNAGNPQTMW